MHGEGGELHREFFAAFAPVDALASPQGGALQMFGHRLFLQPTRGEETRLAVKHLLGAEAVDHGLGRIAVDNASAPIGNGDPDRQGFDGLLEEAQAGFRAFVLGHFLHRPGKAAHSPEGIANRFTLGIDNGLLSAAGKTTVLQRQYLPGSHRSSEDFLQWRHVPGMDRGEKVGEGAPQWLLCIAEKTANFRG